MCVPGYEVTMWVWVESKTTGHTLVEPRQFTAVVHPPVWTQDDLVALEMSLDHQAKLKFLVELRKDPNPSPKVLSMLVGSDFIIRGLLQKWKSPQDQHGQYKTVIYPPHQLRAA
jgi:hypothetical protein